MHRRRLFKSLGLAILAIVAALAINASAAQAKWMLSGGSEDGGGVLLLHLNTTILLGQFLLYQISSHFHCQGGTSLILFQTNSAMSTLTGSGTATITNCLVDQFEKICTVRTPGQSAGTIVMSFEGTAAMNGTETFMNLEDEAFTAWVYEGPLCPYNEIEGMVNGSMKLALPGAETSASAHTGSLDDIEMFYGEENLFLHGANLATPMALHATRVDGGNWAIQLTGL